MIPYKNRGFLNLKNKFLRNKKAQIESWVGLAIGVLLLAIGVSIIGMSSHGFKDYSSEENFQDFYEMSAKRFLVVYLRTPVEISEQTITMADLIALNENNKYNNEITEETQEIIESYPMIYRIIIKSDDYEIPINNPSSSQGKKTRSYSSYIPSPKGPVNITINLHTET
ncbi:hypothetical protein JW949_02435 [Candidatus Woesearchaeota archaeon]|nr:hypothetical protein [Candidatus Woesearchaeota archaeon]